ncbi:hypothetical protein GWK47_027720 [Chionoecetes opilio]|uniref:Uncharacterized protein n=1 Tax=Chionoecetes opilio TaxID=41210 RepID=A0A8J8WC38_CHIOP|nr:hypothetical protein GWK47_027720 [Chionoecetes opilio]
MGGSPAAGLSVKALLTTITPGWWPLDDSTDINEDPEGLSILVEARWSRSPGSRPTICPGTPLGKWLRLKSEWGPSHKVSISQVVCYWARPTSSSAPLLWVPSDRATPSTTAGSGASSRCQRASPMQARRHHSAPGPFAVPVRGTTWAQVCALHFPTAAQQL